MVIILNSPVAVSLNSEMERLKSDLRLNLLSFANLAVRFPSGVTIHPINGRA